MCAPCPQSWGEGEREDPITCCDGFDEGAGSDNLEAGFVSGSCGEGWKDWVGSLDLVDV